jgi:CHAT domain-containing protein
MHQYEECVAFAAERLKHGMNVQAALMELISLHWLEKPEVAIARGRRYAEILDNRFGEVWFGHLVRLFIGGISPEELLEHAKSPLQKFQALYYVGQYFYLKKQYQVAYDYLQQGVAAMPEEQGLEQANIDHTMNEISVYLDDGNPETKKIPLPILRKLSAFEKILPQLNTIQNPAETYRIAREYADIFEAYYPNNKGILAKLYSSMSVANYDLGNILDSESQIDHAIELSQSEDEDRNRLVLSSYRVQKSRILSQRGDMPAAQQILLDVLKDVDEDDEDIFDYVDALENLGMNYGQLGKFDRAAPLLAKVVDLYRQQGEDFKEHLARVITNEAGLHERMGEPFYAKSKYEEALSIMEKAVGKNNLSYARVLNYLAKCNKDLGFYHEALPQYKEAFALAERLVGKQHPFYATILNNTGKLYEKLYDYEKAEKIFIECLEFSRIGFGEYHPNYALANRNLAGIYANQGRFDEAFPLTLKAIQIWESFYGADNPELATEYTSLAAIYFVNSVYDKAEHYYQKALQVVRHSLGTGHEMYVSALHAYAVAQFFSKRYEDSAASYREALLTAKNIFGSNHPDVSKLSHELANVLKTLGQNEEAISLLDDAIKIQDQFIENAFSVTSEDQRTRYLKNQLDVYHSYISAVVNFGSTDSELLKKAYEVVLKRKGISTEYLSNIHLAYLSRSDSVLKKKTLELFQIRENIFKSNFQVENRQPDENTISRLIARQEALETEISLHFSGSYSFWKSKDWSFEKVLSAMDSELLYIDFIQFPNSLQLEHDSLSIHTSVNESTYAAFVVDPRSPSQIKLVNLGSALIIDHLIQHYRSLIIKGTSVTEVNELGEKLYMLIIEPLLPFIKERRKLMVSPDGLINVLPLQVLPIPNEDRQLIDEYEITHIPVIRDIVKYSAPRSIQSNEAVVVADPDFDYQNDENSKGNFQRLPATKEEGESVADLLKVLPIMGKEAIKQRLLNVSSPTILHLATHGFFLEPLDADEKNSSNLNNLDKLRLLQNPLRRSGLALAGVNAWIRGLPTDSSVDNGMLSAEEVAQLDLRGTQLVILSACKTGLGNIEEGEGVVGMRRSFVLSGAQGLIMSLWSIPDEETKALVLTMYHEILSERSSNCVSALRQAQIAIREKYPHPLFWGGFIYQGDHRNSISLPS